MASVDGGGLPVLFALLTKPEQPLSMAVPRATAESSKPCRKTFLALRVLFGKFIWRPIIEAPLKIHREKSTSPKCAHKYLCNLSLTSSVFRSAWNLDWDGSAEAEIACRVLNCTRRIE